MTQNIRNLFQTAEDEGTISPSSASLLNIPDLGAQIQAGLGQSVDDVQASEVVLVTMLIDDSGSIRFAGNSDAIRQGHNLVLDALRATKQRDSVLIHTRYLNGTILYPYMLIDHAVAMDTTNYNPNGGTPLYDQTVVLLGTVLAKTQEFSARGVPVRSVTVILTDGADEHSTRHDARDVATIISDMLRTENHIIAAIGVEYKGVEFRKIFKEMGLRDEWILTAGSNAHDIRQAFNLVSQSAVRASQSGGNFSQTAAGGFGV